MILITKNDDLLSECGQFVNCSLVTYDAMLLNKGDLCPGHVLSMKAVY